MKYYIDRIEDGVAVMDADSGERITVPVDRLPDGVRDGSVVFMQPDGAFAHDEEAENERRKTLFSKFQNLKNRK